jgi:hypothetical protein
MPFYFPMQKLKMSLNANVYYGARPPAFFWRHTGDIYSSFIPCLDWWQFDLLNEVSVTIVPEMVDCKLTKRDSFQSEQASVAQRPLSRALS